jgi:hypothetical protein
MTGYFFVITKQLYGSLTGPGMFNGVADEFHNNPVQG